MKFAPAVDLEINYLKNFMINYNTINLLLVYAIFCFYFVAFFSSAAFFLKIIF